MLSVIIPTFNRRSLLKNTLDSLNNTWHLGVIYEIIVVDDHSTDGTKEFVASSYPNVVLITNPGKGAPAARNAGLSCAKGEFILYLDSDDLVGENYFLEKVKLLKIHPDVDMVYGESQYFESEGPFKKEDIRYKIHYPLITDTDKNLVHLNNYLRGQFMSPNKQIWRKSFIDKIGGHDTSLLINQDVELFFRAILNGAKITSIKDNSYIYVRVHNVDQRVGVINKSEIKYRQILDLRKKVINEMSLKNLIDDKCLESLSTYLFFKWKELRFIFPDLAQEYLEFAKSNYWPIPLQGGKILKLLTKVLGPVNAVKIKEAIYSVPSQRTKN